MSTTSESWRSKLARCRAECQDSAEVTDIGPLVGGMNQQTRWYQDGAGNIVNEREAFFSVRAFLFRVWVASTKTWVTYCHPMLDYRAQDPGYIVLFTDQRMEHIVVQAKFGGGNPGASLTDPVREIKKGMLMAPSFEASASNLKAGVQTVRNGDLVRGAIEAGLLEGPEIIQDENRFCFKRNGEQVLVLDDDTWAKLVANLGPREFVVTYHELTEIIVDGDQGAGHGGRARSEANEHLTQVFAVLSVLRQRRMLQS